MKLEIRNVRTLRRTQHNRISNWFYCTTTNGITFDIPDTALTARNLYDKILLKMPKIFATISKDLLICLFCHHSILNTKKGKNRSKEFLYIKVGESPTQNAL